MLALLNAIVWSLFRRLTCSTLDGASLDNLYAARTRQAALETRPSGVPSRWHNPSTGNAGGITPTRTYKSAG